MVIGLRVASEVLVVTTDAETVDNQYGNDWWPSLPNGLKTVADLTVFTNSRPPSVWLARPSEITQPWVIPNNIPRDKARRTLV